MTIPLTSPLAGKPIEAFDADHLAATLKALADPVRLRLLSIIYSAPGGEACVCELLEPVALSQPTVSHHLRILTAAGLLTREKRGVLAYYRVVPSAIAAIARLFAVPSRSGARRVAVSS